MNFSHRPILLSILVTLLESHICSSFLHTSPLLAWSTAPGALLTNLISTDFAEEYRPIEQELTFGVTSNSFCPSGSSSLLILTLSSIDQQKALINGNLSPRITQAYNSASPASRIRLAHNPQNTELDETVLPNLVSHWKSDCGGKVILREIKAQEDIDTIFSREIANMPGPYMVVCTTTTIQSLTSLDRRALRKISLAADPQKNSTMPDPHSGLLWRYSFFSDYLIIGILVVVFLLIPPVLLGSHALRSIESPRGLKTKMVGAITESKGN
ncbi:uncharacterized protein MELLADRAFT_76066 [Melampsora larici-populina 98AG31]|uniref:Secreted protein n=1 Tax=Melampsora larici-populina (strain 98AG31 / pathotype 3-4-7) TaxID=747676 RepID=F4S9T9_MELLP|nr:uncharacterized protein MELLADRAFT_76066 [Melampsora larici-populina 98AG31]EGF98574.1 hypothetical protein MELLADRAFT_76066 [Melampsora larici-populina 98AG31]